MLFYVWEYGGAGSFPKKEVGEGIQRKKALFSYQVSICSLEFQMPH